MKIAIASDHGGFALKAELIDHLTAGGYECVDCGTHSADSCDYPDYAAKVCAAVTGGECELGILLCGTGIGMSMAANKHKGIRCALCGDCFSAEMTRRHNNANVLAMGARVTGPELAFRIADTFLAAPFDGGRHQRRVDKVMAIEGE